MAVPKWDTEVFFSALSGANSAVSPDLIQPDQLSWMLNGTIRGGKPATRPPIRSLGYLPEGIIQGASYFSVQDGMIVVSIGGRLYRLRIAPRSFVSETIPLSFDNSPALKQAWFVETAGSLVVQDGQSDAIIYDGSATQRSDPSAFGVPRGTVMAYGNGRLWVCIAGNQLVAGDIVTQDFQSELQFTETTYLLGGGSLAFPAKLTGLAFSPTSNVADYGPLIVFGNEFTSVVRADITNRDLWAQIPAFINTILRNIGAVGQGSITPVNQDLYWRDSQGGIRSLSSALADQSSAGSVPLSREVARITDFETTSLLQYASSTYFDNRLLVLASPFINPLGAISYKHIISLDFAPISTMRGKAPPAYDGAWSGAQFTNFVTGIFAGRQRCFGLSSDSDGNNRLWEIFKKGIADESEVGLSPIVSYLETGRRNFQNPKARKKLARCDVYLTDIQGEIEMKVYWRPDDLQKWQQWDAGEIFCAKMEDASTAEPHVWKNLLPQYRPQVNTFTVPAEVDDITKFSKSVAFEFQLRIVCRGKCRVARVLLHATVDDNPVWSNREVLFSDCVENDVTDNQIIYTIPIRILAGQILTTEDGVDIETEDGLLLGAG